MLGSADTAAVIAKNPLARADEQKAACRSRSRSTAAVSMADSVAAYEAEGCKITAQVDWYRQGRHLHVDAAGQSQAKSPRRPGVDSVKLSLKPIHRAGKVPGRARRCSMPSPPRPTTTRYGAGIKVGAQSDSYNKLELRRIRSTPPRMSPAATCLAPANPEGYTTPVTVVAEGPSGR